MCLKLTKAIWDYLKVACLGDERIRSIHLLNLMRKNKLQRVKESETIKEYSDLLSIANLIRLRNVFADSTSLLIPELLEKKKIGNDA